MHGRFPVDGLVQIVTSENLKARKPCVLSCLLSMNRFRCNRPKPRIVCAFLLLLPRR
jgi:hypothetical protein